MAKAKFWLCAFTVLLTAVCWVFADHTATPVTDVLFVHVLERKHFQNGLVSFQSDIIPDGNNCLTFATNLKGHPDRPGWLRYTQRTPHDDGMLYGTPTLNDVGWTVIEVTAYNRDTFKTMRQMLILNITPRMELDPQTLYEAEFFVKNRNVEEVLPLQEQEDFKSAMAKIWETERLVIVNITSALDVGGRVPLPIEGRKEGVYIKVGSEVPFPECLMEELEPTPCDEELEPTSCEDWFSQFTIDWCKIVLFDKSKPDQPDVAPGDGVLDGGEYEPLSSSLGRRDFYPDYVVTIAVPLAIAVLLFLLLAYIMYCRREGLETRDSKTSDIQLVHHHSIQGNTNELRQMAKGRVVLPPLSTLPMFNARTGERVPPLSSLNYDSSRVPLILDQQ